MSTQLKNSPAKKENKNRKDNGKEKGSNNKKEKGES